jgi:hypothetical protein
MSRDSNLVRSSRLIAIFILLLNIVYCVWAWLGAQEIVYWPTYFPFPCSCLLGMAVSPFILIPVLLLTRFQWKHCAFLFAAVVVCASTGSFFELFSASHLASTRLDEHVYHVAQATNSHGLVDYKLCKCCRGDILCECHEFYRDRSGVEAVSLIADSAANELHIEIGGKLIYTYGIRPRCHTQDGCWFTK